jgi:predicted RNA binding protein YcfA (HicA-like mRNA interferase family)
MQEVLTATICPTAAQAISRIAQIWGRFDVRIRDAIGMIEKDGWRLVAQKGSHRQFKHPVKPGRVTIAGALSDELAPGTLNSILKQARLRGRS